MKTTRLTNLCLAIHWVLLLGVSVSSGTVVWHNGATIGQRAFAGFVRNGRILAVALANSDYDVTDIGCHFLDAAAPLTSVRRPATVPELTLRHYVGHYERDADDQY